MEICITSRLCSIHVRNLFYNSHMYLIKWTYDIYIYISIWPIGYCHIILYIKYMYRSKSEVLFIHINTFLILNLILRVSSFIVFGNSHFSFYLNIYFFLFCHLLFIYIFFYYFYSFNSYL